MLSIRLPRGEWFYDDSRPLGGPGGFGQVFEGAAPGGGMVAVKRLNIDAAQSGFREVAMSDALVGRALKHVIPVMDAGLDADTGRYFVVMARAERSLQSFLRERGRLPEDDVAAVLEDIVRGLLEIEDVVHRDLKPANVLFHEGGWKLADLGIARFAEEATSLHTMKDSLSPPYAAPEQWLGQRASHATDVYALGCTAFELLQGVPPFPGPTTAEYQRQHLDSPPFKPDASPGMQLLVINCLRKPPGARPALSGVLDRLQALGRPAVGRAEALMAQAAADLGRARAEREAEERQHASRAEQREQLAQAGLDALSDIAEELFARIDRATQGEARKQAHSRELGRARLELSIPFSLVSEGAFEHSKLPIVAGARITVTQSGDQPCGGRGANLWYGDLRGTDNYGWYEQAYMVSALSKRPRPSIEPFGVSLPDHLRAVDEAHAPGYAMLQRASKLRAIEGAGLEPFFERWLERFAAAARGGLQVPNHMPDEDVNTP